ncbi:hypothetical protein BCR42DRAFT_437915 [Absidia repens]|uniref:tRNA (guanine(10)-N(2))-methyltransferase TRMT11 N-terminal domain-containing protein n=1 Tax=Absidia repens TaxID=90262 RepID=A0A1X2IFG6_9FUNG|nr:hypothetical protein BCR42DRAFT_437915 [Absidia repens]
MPFYLIQFAQSHDEFRLPEFESLAVLENVQYNYSKDSYRLDNPYFKVELESDEDARKIVKRSILVKKVYELWGEGKTYEEVNQQVIANKAKWADYQHSSFKFSVSAFGWTLTAKEQLDIINSFSYLGFEGDIDLKDPQVKFGVLEDYEQQGAFSTHNGTPPPRQHIYMGRLVATGSRDLVQKYNLKKRHYLGTTSMDAELSLVMANQALASPGKLVYDPFVGTGSFLFTCAHFGSFTLGSDIDGRQIRGKSKDHGVKSNIEQYNLQGRVLDSLVFDVTRNPWRCDDWLDAIVTAPYGVRAGAKKLGRKDEDKKPLQLRSYEGVPMHLRQDYYPPTKPYEMSEVLSDLLEFSAKHLRIGGRLVYWLPTVVDEYSNTDVPQHPSMALISNSEQNFGQWSRRLITMEKIRSWDSKEHTTITHSTGSEDATTTKSLGHYLFREKYFSFGRQDEEGQGPM